MYVCMSVCVRVWALIELQVLLRNHDYIWIVLQAAFGTHTARARFLTAAAISIIIVIFVIARGDCRAAFVIVVALVVGAVAISVMSAGNI